MSLGFIDYRIIVLTFGMIALDVVTGFGFAVAQKRFKSCIMREGMIHKMSSIILIATCGLLDYGMIIIWNTHPFLMKSMCIYIFVMEALSIVENVRDAGFPVPKFLVNMLDSKREEIE